MRARTAALRMKYDKRSNSIARVWFKPHATKGLPLPQNDWRAVDEYIVDQLIMPAEGQQETLDANRLAGLPEIDVSAPQGKFLSLLAAVSGALYGRLRRRRRLRAACAPPARGQ